MRELFYLLTGVAVMGYVAPETPVPVTDAPKQSHYAIFVEVCGSLELILVTTEPPRSVNRHQEASAAFMEALRNTPLERVIRLKHRDWFCPETERT